HNGAMRSVAQKEFTQIFPTAGWVEHEPGEIWASQIGVAAEALGRAHVRPAEIAAVGITNQRETTVVWDRETGEPIHNAIVWQDTRTGPLVHELAGDEGPDRLRDAVGLPLSTYFSGPKIRWLLDNVKGAQERAEHGELFF